MLLHAVLPSSAINRLKHTAALQQTSGKSITDMGSDTPAQKLLSLLEGLIDGMTPSLNTLASVIAALRTRQDLYAPTNLGQRIREAAGMDVSHTFTYLFVTVGVLLLPVGMLCCVDGVHPLHPCRLHSSHLAGTALHLKTTTTTMQHVAFGHSKRMLTVALPFSTSRVQASK